MSRHVVAVAAGAVWLGNAGFASGQASIRAIDVLPAGNSPDARAVNHDGSVVVGSFRIAGGLTRAYRWTDATGMQDLGTLPGISNSSAAAVSSDGSVVVGWAAEPSTVALAYRWTSAEGMVSLGTLDAIPYCVANGVSGDGTVVVGNCSTLGGGLAFRWTAGMGMMSLGSVNANAISHDGMVIVGYDDTGVESTAFRWTAGTGVVDLPLPAGIAAANAAAVNANGTVLVGSFERIGGGGAHPRPFRWTAAGGMQEIVLPGAAEGNATSVSADGNTVVGWFLPVGAPWVWRQGAGVQTLEAILTAGGADLAGWQLSTPTGVSADGRVVVGHANYYGADRAFVAVIQGPCYANCDGSSTPPILNINDLTCYLDQFASGNAHANCDGSTAAPVLNILDFICFLDRFAAGCS